MDNNYNVQQPMGQSMNYQMPQQSMGQPIYQEMSQQPMYQEMPQQPMEQPMYQQMPQQSMGQPMYQQMPQQPMEQPMYQQMPQQPKKNNKGLIIGIVAAVVVLGFLAIFWAMKPEDKTKDKNELICGSWIGTGATVDTITSMDLSEDNTGNIFISSHPYKISEWKLKGDDLTITVRDGSDSVVLEFTIIEISDEKLIIRSSDYARYEFMKMY